MPSVFSGFDAPDLWERLKNESRDILLYGMGNGADKILAVLSRRGIPVAGIFASDGFVRGHSFHGMPVRSFSEIEATYPPGGCVILPAFGSSRAEVLTLFDRVAARYELLVPDVPVCGETLFDRAFFTAHTEDFLAARGLFADEESRRIFDLVIRAKLTGSYETLMAAVSPADTAELLSLSTVTRAGDFGAYNGDTARELIGAAPGLSYLLCAEPDPRSFKKLSEWAATCERPQIDCRRAAVSDRAGTLAFDASGNRNAGAATGRATATVSADTVDALFAGAPADYLKFDVEGSEAAALLGSAGTIARFAPRLKIACYHRAEDLFALPQLAHRLCPSYRLYLRRARSVPAWDIDLLCRV